MFPGMGPNRISGTFSYEYLYIWIPYCIDTNCRTWTQKQIIPFTDCWNHEEAPQNFSFQSLVLSL